MSKQLLVGKDRWLVQTVKLGDNQLVHLVVELVGGQALTSVGTVEETQLVELSTWNRLGEQQGLGRFGPAQSQEQGGRGGALSDQTQVGEGRQHVSVVLVVHVNQVTQGHNGSGKTDNWTVKSTHQHLGVVVQQVSQVDVSTDKVLEPELVGEHLRWVRVHHRNVSNVGTSREVLTLSLDNRHHSVLLFIGLVKVLGQLEVLRTVQGVQLGLHVDGDRGDSVLNLVEDVCEAGSNRP